MNEFLRFGGTAIVAGALAVALAMLAFQMTLDEALGVGLMAAIVAISITYLSVHQREADADDSTTSHTER